MYAIVGVCGFGEDLTQKRGKWSGIVSGMLEKLKYRTQDESGLHLDTNYAFGHVRFLERGLGETSQPVVKTAGERTYAIIFGGELYNRDELKSSLIKEGAVFKTRTDAETVLEGFIRHGESFVHSINGVFAFAVWDGEKLWLFRDRAGIKPLFYAILKDRIIFASQIKGILAYPEMKAAVGRDGLCQIFGLGPARTGGSGVFEGIDEICAGHYGVYTREGIKTFKYWDVKSEIHTYTYEETVEKTAWLVKDAIKRQTVAGGSVCSMLSGGVDSSIVTAVAAAELKKSGKRIDTFSFDFDGNDRYFTANTFQPDRDRPWVDKMVDFTGSNHRYLECGTRQMADLLYDSVKARDLPGMADIDSSLLYFSRELKKYSGVALTGECADEIFGGYPWFHKKEMLDAETFPWSRDIATRGLLLSGDLRDGLDLEGYVNARYLETVGATPKLDGESPEEARRREISYLNLKWFMATLIDRLDRMSTYAGICARAPFADYRIIEYAWNVPWKMKNRDLEVKHLLRASANGILPDEILYRKKSPYPKSYNPEYEEILNGRIIDILNDVSSPLIGLIDKEKTQQFMTSTHDYGKPWYGQLMAGPQRLAYLIQIDFWLREYKIEIKI